MHTSSVKPAQVLRSFPDVLRLLLRPKNIIFTFLKWWLSCECLQLSNALRIIQIERVLSNNESCKTDPKFASMPFVPQTAVIVHQAYLHLDISYDPCRFTGEHLANSMAMDSST